MNKQGYVAVKDLTGEYYILTEGMFYGSVLHNRSRAFAYDGSHHAIFIYRVDNISFEDLTDAIEYVQKDLDGTYLGVFEYYPASDNTEWFSLS